MEHPQPIYNRTGRDTLGDLKPTSQSPFSFEIGFEYVKKKYASILTLWPKFANPSCLEDEQIFIWIEDTGYHWIMEHKLLWIHVSVPTA